MGTNIKKKLPNISCCVKRCGVEMLDLYETYHFNSIKIELFNSCEVHFIIEEFGGKVLKFILSYKYPFIEPTIINCIKILFYRIQRLRELIIF